MALPAAFLSEEQFSCSICLDVFTDPVSTPCGHSFCQSCISSYWDRGVKGGAACHCPLCKKSFRKRPELHINRALQDITQHFKQVASTWSLQPQQVQQVQQQQQQQQRGAEMMPESIFAEMMTRFRGVSTSSETSEHSPGGVHQGLPEEQEGGAAPPPTLRRHSVGGALDSSLPVLLCPVHRSELLFFCRTDNICLCHICTSTAQHQGHTVTSAKREWFIKKSQIGITEMELKDLIQERENKVQELQNSLREIKAAAERETDGVVCAFTKLISTVECCQSQVLELIEAGVRAAESQSHSLLQELEEELQELRRRSSTLTQLTQTSDYVLFLKMFPSLSSPLQTKSWSSVSLSSSLSSGLVSHTVSQTMERLQEEIHKLPEVCQLSPSAVSVPRPSMKVKRVQEYAAHPRLIISADGKQVHCGESHRLVPDSPERFDRVVCVLAQQGFSSGRHYWEVEVGAKTDWDLGIASHSINRKGRISVSPAHGYWFLSLRDRTDYAFRTEPSTPLSVSARPARVGIYVDCEKGLLSFYNVEARLLLYTFSDSFTDVIRPFFSPCTNRSGRNEAPLIIRPVTATE